MRRIDRLLLWLAGPDSSHVLEEAPGLTGRLRLVARIGLRFFWVYVFVFLLALVVTLGSGMDIYHRTELPQFCNMCHEMSINFDSWEISRHSSIRCVDCHARAGFSGWLAAKTGGLRQLARHFSAETIEDIHVGDEQRQVVSENCQRCHQGATRVQERHGIVIAHDRHLQMGIGCVECHTRAFAHPVLDPDTPADAPVPLASPATCVGCHSGDSRYKEASPFLADDLDSCVRCHPDSSLGNQHGSGDLSCDLCHEKGATGHFALPETQISQMCETCHDLETGHTSVHPPYQQGQCLACHRVMSPAHLYRTGPEPNVATCFICHEEIRARLAGEPWAQASRFTGDPGDLHVLHGELLGDEKDWCMHCHAPHGSGAAAGLIRLRADTGDDDPDLAGQHETTPGGGACTGACHGEDRVEYVRESGGTE